MLELTPEEQIAKAYSACMDSVHLIQAGKPEKMEDQEWADCLARNKAHLVLMLAKNMFAGYDLTLLQQAAGE